MVLRPDELAAESEIQSARQRDKTIKSGIKTVAGVGAAALTARVAPFLSSFITPDIAIKGISKVSPQLGGFLQRGMEKGLDIRDGLEFIKDNLGQTQEKPKEHRGVIQQYSDALDFYIKYDLDKGKTVQQSLEAAKFVPEYKKIIEKIEKDHKVPITTIAESEYGQAQQPQKNAPQQGQQPGQGQQALMSILQKIQQTRGGK